jgi:hypothetical protein
MIWLIVAVTAVAIVALTALYLKNRRAEHGARKPLHESNPGKDAVVEPPARQPVYFKRYDPDDSTRE